MLSGAPENALAESESTLQISREAWEHLNVHKSTGEGNQSFWEVCLWLPDRFTFCGYTQLISSDVWSQLAPMPQCLVTIEYRRSEKKWWNSDWRAIWNQTRGFGARRGVICHRGVSDGFDWVSPLWRSHSAQTEMLFADEFKIIKSMLWYYILLLPNIMYTVAPYWEGDCLLSVMLEHNYNLEIMATSIKPLQSWRKLLKHKSSKEPNIITWTSTKSHP